MFPRHVAQSLVYMAHELFTKRKRHITFEAAGIRMLAVKMFARLGLVIPMYIWIYHHIYIYICTCILFCSFSPEWSGQSDDMQWYLHVGSSSSSSSASASASASASFQHHFIIISASFHHHFSIISALFQHHFIIISSSFQHHFSIISACIPATFPKSNIIKHSISQTFPSPSQDKKQCVEKFLLPIGPDIRAMRAKEREAYCLLVGFWGKHQAWRPGRLGDLFLEISREFESHPTRPGWL